MATDYKNTLHMPVTDFEMRGNLNRKEPEILKRWEEDQHFQNVLLHHKGQRAFVLHDGPPYANGNLHAGTAMNRCIKDFINRTHAMSGCYTPYFPGWDTHGLPIENAIQKLGVDRKAMSAAEFRRKCADYAHRQIIRQMETEKRLGQMADYDHPYITLNKDFEKRQIQAFAKMALDGLIFQGLKPVYWSPFNETAVADSEIIYKDVQDATIYLAFQVADGKGLLSDEDYFVIWTTTPWTIPANQAVSLHADLIYAEVQTEKGKLIFLEKFIEPLLAKFGLTNQGLLRTFSGKQLEGITYHHVVLNKTCPVIVGSHVTDADGTGVVHTAGGHGMDDYLVLKQYGIDPICTVDARGMMNEEAGSYVGMFFEDCSKAIIHDMKEKGCLLAVENITHSYPHDDRLKQKVIFRAVKQWFCSIDRVRGKVLKQIDHEILWHNEWGQVRMHNMIQDRGDWCISRQRLWGVPIPIFYCEDGTPIMEKEVFAYVAELFGTFGSNVWFEREAKELLPQGYTNDASPNGIFTKEKDIMDVWFDSGSSWMELEARGLSYPCDLYFEGSDQYRGWFNSSLVIATAVKGGSPYKEVLSHGYVVDAKGEKMSKSVGNVIDPMDIINQNGADVFRLWAMTSDFKADLKLGAENIKQVREQYRKIRNTFRFLLGNVHASDFNPQEDLLAYDDLLKEDRYILTMLDALVAEVQKDVLAYDYVSASKAMMNFMVNTLSAYYLDYTKDILYCNTLDHPRRRQVQSVYWITIAKLVRLWAPFLVYTMEEVWLHFNDNCAKSVHYTEFPKAELYADAKELQSTFARLLTIRSIASKAIEDARNADIVHSSQEAALEIHCTKADENLLKGTIQDALPGWFIVSQVSFVEDQDCRVVVSHARGTKCPRCWNYTESGDEHGLCPRCHAVLEKEQQA